jgi:hypothetical protein
MVMPVGGNVPSIDDSIMRVSALGRAAAQIYTQATAVQGAAGILGVRRCQATAHTGSRSETAYWSPERISGSSADGPGATRQTARRDT